MISERLVKALYPAEGERVSVDIEHERENFHPAVPDKPLYRHIIYFYVMYVLELKYLRDLVQVFALHKCQILAFYPEHTVEGWHHNVHCRIDLCSGGKLAVQLSVERLEHRHNGVDSRHHLYDFLCSDVIQIEAESRSDVALGACGIEPVESQVAYICHCLDVCQLGASFLYVKFGRKAAHLHF